MASTLASVNEWIYDRLTVGGSPPAGILTAGVPRVYPVEPAQDTAYPAAVFVPLSVLDNNFMDGSRALARVVYLIKTVFRNTRDLGTAKTYVNWVDARMQSPPGTGFTSGVVKQSLRLEEVVYFDKDSAGVTWLHWGAQYALMVQPQ